MTGSKSASIDKGLLFTALLLMIFGIVVVYTASAPQALKIGLPAEYYLKAHLQKIVIALGVLIFCAKLDYGFWKKFSRAIFIVGCALTIAALVVGGETKGANRWIWGIQPSEILKFGLICGVCAKLSDAGDEIKTLKCSIIQPGIPFLIAAVLLVMQPNLSMMMLFSFIMVSVLFVAQARAKYLMIASGVGGVASIIIMLVKSHSSKRIMNYFNEGNAGNYQVNHALDALGNGGLWGTGVGMGMQKLGYLPEAHKDVAYSVIGEEFGFVGTVLVLCAFGFLFYKGFKIAQNSSTRFGKYMAVGLTISLFLNFFIHICVCTGLGPTTGQPLPFLSFGGTSLICSAAFIGVLLNISKPGTGKIKERFVYKNYEYGSSV